MSASSGRTLRFVSGAAALVVFTFVLPLVQPGALKANDVLYTVKDLGALNCCYSWSAASAALALNAHGDVAGLTSSPSDSQRQVPFVYHNGTMTMISDTYGWAAGINDARQVTGVFTPPGLLGGHAFVYQDGVFTDIGTIVGDSNAAAFVYDNGTMSIVKRLSARTAYAINDLGDVVGLIETVRGGGPQNDHAFLFSDNSVRIYSSGLGHSLISGSIYGPQASITCPEGSVAIAPGENIQTAVKANPGATTFCLQAGTHPITSAITPKSGNTFIGEYGAILDASGWSSSDLDDAVFKSVNNGVTNVTIRNLVLRDGPCYGINSFLTAANWTVDHTEIAGFRNGVSLGTGGVLSHNWIHHNTGIFSDPNPALRGGGIILAGSEGVQITHNDVSYNGREQKMIAVAAGLNRNLYLAHNFYHHNEQNGIWFDGDAAGSIVEDNTIEDNGASGIVLESTDGVIVRNNIIRRHTAGEGILITVAKNNTITGNLLDACRYGIGLYLDFGSMPPNSPTFKWNQDMANNTISGNTVHVRNVGDWAGMFTLVNQGLGGTDPTPYSTNTKNNNWSSNTYFAPNTTGNWFQWLGVNKSFTQWQALAQDTLGTITAEGSARYQAPGPPTQLRVIRED